MGCRISRKQFDYLMREYRLERLLSQEAYLRRQVPASTDRAAERAFAQMQAAVVSGAPVSIRPAKAAGASIPARALAVAVSAAVLVGAGAYAASPSVRAYAQRAVTAHAQADGTASRRARQPRDYVIPSPGEGFEVTEESESERMTARWFTARRQQVLVEIAYKLPDELVKTADVEFVTVGGLPGTVYETDGIELMILRDGDVYILIEYFNADRQELTDYAEALAALNSETNE